MGTREVAGNAVLVGFVVASVLAIITLWRSVPLDSLATPTTLCAVEVAAVAGIFLVYVAVLQPAREALDASQSPVMRFMRHRVELPRAARALALALFVFGLFLFAFWAVSDVIGGYNGYNWTFAEFPSFATLYYHAVRLVPYIGSRDKGTQASFYLGLAFLGLVVLRLGKGMGAALKDAVTLFAAPCVLLFELGLWLRAPEDMTWHVTDFLWLGGIADGGFRQNDFVRVPFVNYPAVDGGRFLGAYASGPYVFSNWFVLCVAFFLIASRLPRLSVWSAALWHRRARKGTEGEAGGSPAGSSRILGRAGLGGPGNRGRLSALARQGSGVGAYRGSARVGSWDESASTGPFESGSNSTLGHPS